MEQNNENNINIVAWFLHLESNNNKQVLRLEGIEKLSFNSSCTATKIFPINWIQPIRVQRAVEQRAT